MKRILISVGVLLWMIVSGMTQTNVIYATNSTITINNITINNVISTNVVQLSTNAAPAKRIALTPTQLEHLRWNTMLEQRRQATFGAQLRSYNK